MGEDLSTFSVDKVANRIETTERLLKGIQISDDEGLFLRMATQLKDSWSETTSALYSSKILVHVLGCFQVSSDLQFSQYLCHHFCFVFFGEDTRGSYPANYCIGP